MTRLIIILILALVAEAIGVVFLSKGLKEIAAAVHPSTSPFVIVPRAAVHPTVLLGVAFEAAFFAALLYLLSQRDVSVIWPLTALGFVVTTLAARFVLHERISATRWAGITLIVIGAALVCYTESLRDRHNTRDPGLTPSNTNAEGTHQSPARAGAGPTHTAESGPVASSQAQDRASTE